MKTTYRHSTISLRALLAVLALVIAACATATGPDGTDSVPALGTRYMQMQYGLNGAGQLDTAIRRDTLVTTVIRNIKDPLNPLAIAFADSVVRNDTNVVGPRGTTGYVYYPNGDMAVHHNGRVITFQPPKVDPPNPPSIFRINNVALRDTDVVLPFGSKRDYTRILLDTTAVDSFANRVQITRHTVVDSVFFLGPEVVLPPQQIVLAFTPVSVTHVMVHRAITSFATIGNENHTNRTVLNYHYYYSPTLGYMVAESVLDAGKGGSARLVLPLPLP